MGFTINIAKGVKKKPVSTKPNRVSRLCTGVTIQENGEYKIRISLVNDPEYPDYIVVPFTEQSLDLKDKVKVYEHNKDKYGHYVCHIREERNCHFHPGLPTQYTVVVEKLVCSGYLVRKDGKLWFDLRDTHGFGELVRNLPVKLNEKKPLFPVKDECNTSKSS